MILHTCTFIFGNLWGILPANIIDEHFTVFSVCGSGLITESSFSSVIKSTDYILKVVQSLDDSNFFCTVKKVISIVWKVFFQSLMYGQLNKA